MCDAVRTSGPFSREGGRADPGTQLALARLRTLYAGLDESVYGAYDAALDKLRGMVLGLDGDGEPCLLLGGECPAQVEIPYGIRRIGAGAFRGQRKLEQISLPASLTELGEEAFAGCAALRSVRLPPSLQTLGKGAFRGCAALEEACIPDRVTRLEEETFAGCPLVCLSIGRGLQSVHTGAFTEETPEGQPPRAGGRDIRRVTVAPGNPHLKAADSCVFSSDGRILYAALGQLRRYAVPEGVETIAAAAFRGLAGLTEVTLPSSLRRIGPEAFAATGLRSVSFGGALRSIGDGAFSRCRDLTSALFCEGLEEIGERAFAASPIFSVVLPASLRSIRRSSFDCLSDPYLDRSQRQELRIAPGGSLEADGTALYHVDGPERTLLSLYKRSVKLYTVKPGTTAIAPDACGGGNDLFTIILPPGLRSIGDRAFQGCDGLQHIAFPESLREIGAQAFHGTRIAAFFLPAALREVGPGAFATGRRSSRESALRSIKVAKDNPVLHRAKHCLLRRKADGTDAVLSHFGREETVVLPGTVSEICGMAFYRNVLREVQLPASVTAVGENAFEGCASLRRLRLETAQGKQGAGCIEIYFPPAGEDDRSAAALRARYMDCIRGNRRDALFDFAQYDSLFPAISSPGDKVLVAVDRLKSARQLTPEHREQYLAYLRGAARQTVEIVVSHDDLAGLNTLAQLGIFTGENIDACIELANTARRPEVLSFLINYKNAAIGMDQTDYEL